MLVHENGEIMVKVYTPREGFCFVSARRAGLSEQAKRKAWAASGFRIGGTK